MKNILVTGGAGFIGSHTVVELINSGFNPIIIDDFSNSNPDVFDKILKITGKTPTWYEGDVADKDTLSEIFKKHKIDAVIHFAGFKAVGESVSLPLKYYKNNLYTTLTLIEVMKEFSCNNFIFSSSATVYGPTNPIPYVEDMPTSATNPYGYTKVMIEQILRDECVANPEFTACLLRYFNPIGAHESGLIGENPSGIPNNLMPYICKVASGELECLSVFGGDYDTPDGTCRRDYIHVVDLAKGHIAALNYSFTIKGSDAINIGTGNGTSVLEIVEAFQKASGVPVNYKIVGRRDGDIQDCWADTSKLHKVLNFKTSYGIDKMCADSWNYIQKNK